MGKNGKLERLSRQLIKLLSKIPDTIDEIEIETGVELKFVAKIFVKIRIIFHHLSMQEQSEINHESKEENIKCLHDDAEGTFKRVET